MDIFNTLKKLVKRENVCIDNNIFCVCTKLTFIILLGMSVLITSKQYIGDPIHCIVDVIPEKVMAAYCWFYSTFTLANRLTGVTGRDMIQPGVASYSEHGDTLTYHRYYQWVCFALFFQALWSYSPRYIWKSFEGGRLKALTEDLNKPIIDDDIKAKRKAAVVTYFKEHLNQQTFYAYRFFLCELINFGNAIGQVYFTNFFLDGEFLSYGIDVLMHENAVDPMTRIFPKTTKCTFHKYGPSGSVQNFDGLCILPINILNEKVFLFLWFWFIGLSIISGVALIYRVCVCYSSKLRLCLLQARAQLVRKRDIEYIMLRLEIADWFMLYYFCKNVDPMIFKEICRELVVNLYSEF